MGVRKEDVGIGSAIVPDSTEKSKIYSDEVPAFFRALKYKWSGDGIEVTVNEQLLALSDDDQAEALKILKERNSVAENKLIWILESSNPEDMVKLFVKVASSLSS